MPLSTEDQLRITDLRRRVLAGEDVKPDEYRSVLDLIRQNRVSAAAASAAKPRKKSAPVVDLDALFKTPSEG